MTADPQSVNTVSVVIPVFNAATWIKETIDSILAQTYPVLEILIVDDGSTDETAGIVQEYGARVRYIYQEHRGVSAARNRGIAIAKGNFIAFIDGDDYWHPRKIESQIKLLNEKKLSWVSCETQPFNTNTRLPMDGLVPPMQDGDVLKALFMNNFIGSATPLVQRSVFDEVGLFNEARIGEDWDMWLRIASIHPLGVVYEKLAFLRIHSASAMSSTSIEEKVKCLVEVIERAAERDINRLGSLKKEALAGVYYNAGVQSFKQGLYSQAGNYFRNEIKYRPLKLESRIYWLMTKSGPNFSRLLINGKRFLAAKFTRNKKK